MLRNRLLVATLALLAALPVTAQVGDDSIVDAREALRKKDKAKLSTLRNTVVNARHPLAMWVDYWDLGSRLPDAQQTELDAFYARWPGTYVEDRLRNDWLLELGRRRDWANFVREFPRFRMNDDREVTCYALLTQHQAGQDVRAQAVAAWHAQRDLDDGCHLLAGTLAEARKLSAGDIWHEMRLSVEANRPRAARAAAALLGQATAQSVGELLDQPARLLKRRIAEPSAQHKELVVLALLRLASTDADAAANELAAGWARALDDDQAAYAWAFVARQAAQRLQDGAHELYQQAWKLQRSHGHPPRWSDDTLAWGVRAALRAPRLDRDRWASGAAGHRGAGCPGSPGPGLGLLEGPGPEGPRTQRCRPRTRPPAAAGGGRWPALPRPAGGSAAGPAAAAAAGTATADRGRTRAGGAEPGPAARPADGPDRPARRRPARMELHAARHGRP
jgi:hypothetical protein